MDQETEFLRTPEVKQIEIGYGTIELVHRHEDFVVFMHKQKSTGRMRPFVACRIKEIRSLLHFQELMTDGYMSVNGFFSGGHTLTDRQAGSRQGLRAGNRKEGNASYLNAVFCDLDVGRPDDPNPARRITDRHAEAAAKYFVAEEIIPPISIVTYSGRGIQLWWLLRDEADPSGLTSHQLPKPWDERFKHDTGLFKNIEREIVRRLTSLGADEVCIDISREFRIPNSIHSGVNKPVCYQVEYQDWGVPLFYTLREMAEFFGADSFEHKEPQPALAAPKPGQRKNLNCASGPRALAAARASDMLKIEAHMKGWAKGCRQVMLNYYGEFLKASGQSFPEIVFGMKAMAARCNPPFTAAGDASIEVMAREIIEREGWRQWKTESLVKKLSIVGNFNLTPALARRLRLKSIVPAVVKAEIAGKEKAKSSKRTAARRKMKERDQKEITAWIQEIIDIHGLQIGCRQIADKLKQFHNLTISHETVNKLKRGMLPKNNFLEQATKPKRGRPPKVKP